MANPLSKYVPARFLPLAGLIAGRPDVARLHLDGQTGDETTALRNEVAELRLEVDRLRAELSLALRFLDDEPVNVES